MKKKKSEVILPAKKKTKSAKKTTKKTAKKGMNLYSSLSYKRLANREAEDRRRAEDLADLPKEPVKRFFARLHPKRVAKWFFSKRGQKAIWKGIAAVVLLCVIFIGGLFLYYKKDLSEIRLDEMSIDDTVNTYLDRNGELLWQDTGSENYRLVVNPDEIAETMYQATVAIEDKNFYNHIGVDFGALIRATLSTVSGHGVQGGSTLTQQLIKQVYFADEAQSENRGGLTRKIKELILAIELERMYSKDQILTMYLNQSPYGGRRNGVESGAQTYFGKSAKDLTLAESALLASIPNNPGVYDPYNEYGNEELIERQHKTLDSMVEMGYITQDEADEAKQVAILDTIKPESAQYAGIKAPHFVLEVKKQLEEKYGIQTMRAGGWTIKTTVDSRAQQIAEDAVALGMTHTYKNGSDNIALVSVDVETSQVIAMVGSADFSNPTYGEQNVTTDSLIEPGSSIKPILDYSPLFMQRDGVNYGPGSVLRDENINNIYCAGATGPCTMTNATGQFYGDVTIRFSLGHSLNIAAVKALHINGIENSLDIAHKLGDTSYCKDRSPEEYGLSIAIGSGCNVRMVEHANAYASLARGGAYKDLSYILELKNSSGEVVESWEDKPAEQVVDPQVAYMVANILSDPTARWYNNEGFVVPGVWTATKTGTTTTANSAVTKDSLIESFSTAVSTFVWNGNHDGSGLWSNSNDIVRFTVGNYMERVHKEVYEPDGRWHSGDQMQQPAGIQRLTVNGRTDIWPSWYNSKNTGVSSEKLTFNKYNHKLAASCTPDDQKIEIEVTKTVDPLTKQNIYNVPEPYDRSQSDDCSYKTPSVSFNSDGTIVMSKGTSAYNYEVYLNGNRRTDITFSDSGEIQGYTPKNGDVIKVVVTDTEGASSFAEHTYKGSVTDKSNNGSSGDKNDDDQIGSGLLGQSNHKSYFYLPCCRVITVFSYFYHCITWQKSSVQTESREISAT